MNSIKFFISYNHDDSEIALKVREECNRLHIDNFLDRKDIGWGDGILDSVGAGLAGCTHLLLILSPGSLKSNWVFYEVGRAIERGIAILSFLVHKALDPPAFLRDRKHVDSFDQLRLELEDLARKAQDRAESIRDQLHKLPQVIEGLHTSEKARLAMRYSVNALLTEHHKSLDDLERGEITARAPEMYRIYGHFIDASEKFRAISAEDLDYWLKNDSLEYLDHNERLIERNGTVERIFLVDQTEATVGRVMEKLKYAMIRQIKMGIRVRLAYYMNCNDLGDKGNIRDLDFGLFDDFAVSFFRFGEGRSYTISLRHDQCDFRRSLFERVAKRCENVPGKSGLNKAVFENEAELTKWADSITCP